MKGGEVTIDVPGRFRGRVTFRRFYFKRGKMSRWFWTAESALRLDQLWIMPLKSHHVVGVQCTAAFILVTFACLALHR